MQSAVGLPLRAMTATRMSSWSTSWCSRDRWIGLPPDVWRSRPGLGSTRVCCALPAASSGSGRSGLHEQASPIGRANRRPPGSSSPLLVVAVAVQQCAAAVAARDGVRAPRPALYLPALDLQSSAPHGLGAGTTKPRAGGGGRDNRETQPGRKKHGQPGGTHPRCAPDRPRLRRQGRRQSPATAAQGRFSTPTSGRRPARRS